MTPLAIEIEEQIAAGHANATLIPWVGIPDLLGDAEPTPESSIDAAKLELRERGWTWNASARQMEKDGWLIWFRSQGNCGSPIAQWSRLTGLSGNR